MSVKFNRLTRAAIRTLERGASLHEHGITVERLKTGDLRYSVNVMVDGQRVHRVIGRDSEGVTREQAERAIEAFRTKAREGRLDLPAGRKIHRTFREGAKDYIARLEEIGGRAISRKRQHLQMHLVPYFKDQRADRLTEFTVQHYANYRRGQGATQATINRELATLSHMLRRMADWKWIRKDDIPLIRKGAEPRKQIVVLTPKNQQALLQAAVADQDPYCWLFVAFGLNSGMRHREILNVKWSDIDFDLRRIHIAKAKAGQRDQPITKALADMLENERQQREDQEGYVFGIKKQDGTFGPRIAMSIQFKRAVVRAKLDPAKVTPHVMRHTAITRLVMSKVDIPTIQKISGHKTLAMVLRYVHLAGDHIDSAIAAIETRLPDTITPELHTQSGAAAQGFA